VSKVGVEVTNDRTRTQALVRGTFDRAAEHFDDDELFFWDHFGCRTIDLVDVPPGGNVLDVCCGTGASALPAAERVGPLGSVVGVDLSEAVLERARAKAAEAGLGNAEFVVGDLTDLDLAGATFDLVVCVLGLYFASELPTAAADLWSRVRPGGTVAITTWGARSLEPAQSLYFEAVAEERPDLDLRGSTLSWSRISTPSSLTDVFTAGGLPAPTIVEEVVVRPMRGDGFWPVVLGSGYRILLEVMGAQAAARVRSALAGKMAAAGVEEVTSDVLYARATKRGANT